MPLTRPRTLLIALALTLLALIGGLGIWGTTLPRDHAVSSRVTIAAPAESIYNVMRDFKAIPTWWPAATAIEMVPSTDGFERWRETVDGFEMTIILREEEWPLRMATEIDTTGGSAFGGTWLHEVRIIDSAQSEVTITERGWVSNPYFRVMMKFGGEHTSIDSYLAALAARFGATTTPAHVTP
jgi:hypothetical protein